MPTSNLPQTRICTKCLQEFPLTEEFFYKNKLGKYGLTARCKNCLKTQEQKKRREHPEKQREYEVMRYQRDKEKRDALNREWVANNPEKIKQHRKKFNDANPEKRAKWAKDWESANPKKSRERGRRYAKNHPQKMVARVSKRRTRKKNLPFNFTVQDWDRCLEYFNQSCAVCGRTADDHFKIVQDHWVALTDKSPDNPGTVVGNIVPLCQGVGGCNNSKRNQNAESWLTKKFGPAQAQRILALVRQYFVHVQALAEQSNE